MTRWKNGCKITRMKSRKFITIKTTPQVLKALRLIAAYTGEKQYQVLERLLGVEIQCIEEKGKNDNLESYTTQN